MQKNGREAKRGLCVFQAGSQAGSFIQPSTNGVTRKLRWRTLWDLSDLLDMELSLGKEVKVIQKLNLSYYCLWTSICHPSHGSRPPPSPQAWSLTFRGRDAHPQLPTLPPFLLTSPLHSVIKVQFSYANILQGCSSFIYGILPTAEFWVICAPRGHRPFVELQDESVAWMQGDVSPQGNQVGGGDTPMQPR